MILKLENMMQFKKTKVIQFADKKRNAAVSDISIGDEVILRRDQISSKSNTPFYVNPYIAVNKQGSLVTVRSSDLPSEGIQESPRNNLPSLIGKEEGSNVYGKASDNIHGKNN